MTTSLIHPTRPASLASVDDALRRLAPDLTPSASERERDRELLHGPVEELVRAGFTGLRIPESVGGAGATLEELFGRLIDLAAIDSNLAHVFRGHIGFVESLRVSAPGDAYRGRWLTRVAQEGLLVGNAQSERAATADLSTTLTPSDAGLLLDGVKYYTTGSIYSDWIQLSALGVDGASRVSVLVDARQPGVASIDDWDGFGQQLTGSGTTSFRAARVDPRDVRSEEDRDDGSGDYVAAVFQLVLLAVLAGIAEAALADAVRFVRDKRRIFGYSGETLARENHVVQLTVGRLSANAHAARSLVLAEARALDSALAAAERTAGPERAGILRDALLGVFRAQQVVPPLVLDAATELFEVGGASAVGRSHALDRHWRNARTVFSHNPARQRERAIGEFELNGTFAAWHPAAPVETAGGER